MGAYVPPGIPNVTHGGASLPAVSRVMVPEIQLLPWAIGSRCDPTADLCLRLGKRRLGFSLGFNVLGSENGHDVFNLFGYVFYNIYFVFGLL